MEFSHHIDWITVSRKFMEHEELPDATMRDTLVFAKGEFYEIDHDVIWKLERIVATRFYDFAYRDLESGITINIALDGNNKGVLMVFSGSALERSFDGETLLRDLVRIGWKATRVDVAFDVFYSGYGAVDLADWYENEVATRGISAYSFISGRNGSTLYVGSRKSPIMLRVYDKGKQSLSNIDWLRIEVELKSYAASQFAEEFNGDSRSAEIYVQKLLSLQDHPVMDELSKWVKGVDLVTLKRPVQISDRAGWLIAQVLPAFKTLFEERPIEALQVWENFEQFAETRRKRIEGSDVDNRVD